MRFLRPALIAALVLAGTGGGLLAASAPAAAGGHNYFSGNYVLNVEFFKNGSIYIGGPNSATFGPGNGDDISGVTGTYNWGGVPKDTLKFTINAGCVPAYSGYGDPTDGFGGTIKCTGSGFAGENGYWSMLPASDTSRANLSGNSAAGTATGRR